MIYKISSRQNEHIKEVFKLYQSGERKLQNKFIIEGFHLLDMALKAKQVVEVFTLKELNIDKTIDQYIVTCEILEKLSKVKNPQGVIAVCKCKSPSKIVGKKVLYLDDVSDPGNVGTLLRTALAFGYKDVVLSKNTCSIYNEKVISACQGALFELNIVENMPIANLKKDYQILATEIKGSVSADEFEPPKKFVLVLGNEAHGVSKEILTLADQRIRIDINDIESLNVAVAGGIMMYILK